ncbi:ASPIC/UnbV domain-containing protein [Puia sp. P3]|uniref:ASPIC/UnbV domain-containing protein n=1 Tax=Puia sp. P3 TaxID=3423952 RepID=UPI003D67231D
MLGKIPQVKLKHYAFRNNGNTTFSDVSNDWGLTTASFANGAAYADLDNDGKLDLVINNINDEPFVYRNISSGSTGWLAIKLVGGSLNRNGLGAWIAVYYDGKQQVYEQTPYRGYLSTMSVDPHFGLGTTTRIDSLVVKWPDGKKQALTNLKPNQQITVTHGAANKSYQWEQNSVAGRAWFRPENDPAKIHYEDSQRDFIDFNIQKLLPHKLSEYGPAMAAGDVNGDGLDDIFIGGDGPNPTILLEQQRDGTFVNRNVLPGQEKKNRDDLGLLLFDADGDGDLDLYIAAGGYSAHPNDPSFEDRLYINDGKGNFTPDTLALPRNFTSKSCVRGDRL